MDTRQIRRRALFGLFLAAAGAGLWFFVGMPVLQGLRGPDETRRANDAAWLAGAVRPDPWIEGIEAIPEFELERAARLEGYGEADLADLRDRLGAYVDFRIAEQADAAEIYLTGREPKRLSESARRARERLVAALGDAGRAIVSSFDEQAPEPGLRELAFQASPVVAGLDPDLPDYRAEHERLLAEWLPRTKARIDALTRRP